MTGSWLLLYCRAGFEKECAADILEQTGRLDVHGYVRTREGSGYVQYFPQAEGWVRQREKIRFDDLIFARQLIHVLAELDALPPKDRLTPLMSAIRATKRHYSDLLLETADTNEAKSLSSLLRAFAVPLRRALEAESLIGHDQAPRLHVFFPIGTAALVGLSEHDNASPWPLGIPRLKFPRGAPSRSTLKLDEAFRVFVHHPERELRPGMTAVDLGAAPGGWTWQLVQRHIRTIAVDNGALDPVLLDSGIVEHLRTDGFRYRPAKPVDWLVCDMVEQPLRITALIADWLVEGRCRRAIFNLKLPMKKRYQCVMDCHDLMMERLGTARMSGRVAFRQLYHDRAEVTGYADCLPSRP